MWVQAGSGPAITAYRHMRPILIVCRKLYCLIIDILPPFPLAVGQSMFNTILPPVSSSLLTYFYRNSFSLKNTGCFSALNLEIVLSSGAVVYLNGVEVTRQLMPTGPITSTTLVRQRNQRTSKFHPYFCT